MSVHTRNRARFTTACGLNGALPTSHVPLRTDPFSGEVLDAPVVPQVSSTIVPGLFDEEWERHTCRQPQD